MLSILDASLNFAIAVRSREQVAAWYMDGVASSISVEVYAAHSMHHVCTIMKDMESGIVIGLQYGVLCSALHAISCRIGL